MPKKKAKDKESSYKPGTRKVSLKRYRDLKDKGYGVRQIARMVGVSPGTASKNLKKLAQNELIADLPIPVQIPKNKRNLTEHLLKIADKIATKIDWIDKRVPAGKGKEGREWQKLRTTLAAEIRKVYTFVADIEYKRVAAFELKEARDAIQIILEELKRESPELCERVLARIEGRRADRQPDIGH